MKDTLFRKLNKRVPVIAKEIAEDLKRFIELNYVPDESDMTLSTLSDIPKEIPPELPAGIDNESASVCDFDISEFTGEAASRGFYSTESFCEAAKMAVEAEKRLPSPYIDEITGSANSAEEPLSEVKDPSAVQDALSLFREEKAQMLYSQSAPPMHPEETMPDAAFAQSEENWTYSAPCMEAEPPDAAYRMEAEPADDAYRMEANLPDAAPFQDEIGKGFAKTVESSPRKRTKQRAAETGVQKRAAGTAAKRAGGRFEGGSLDDIISGLGRSFQQELFRKIDARGLSDSQVYRKANLDRRLFSKIRSNVNYKPAKGTAFALVLALGLNLDEATDLLSRAGLAFSPSSIYDLIVKYCVINGIHDICEVNALLYEHDQPLLGS